MTVLMAVDAFALYGGITIYSVHPSVDDAIAKASSMGFTVKRESPTGCVFDKDEGLFSGAGITPCQIVPSEFHHGYWCIKGAECENERCLQLASEYFQEEDWMLATH